MSSFRVRHITSTVYGADPVREAGGDRVSIVSTDRPLNLKLIDQNDLVIGDLEGIGSGTYFDFNDPLTRQRLGLKDGRQCAQIEITTQGGADTMPDIYISEGVIAGVVPTDINVRPAYKGEGHTYTIDCTETQDFLYVRENDVVKTMFLRAGKDNEGCLYLGDSGSAVGYPLYAGESIAIDDFSPNTDGVSGAFSVYSDDDGTACANNVLHVLITYRMRSYV